MKPIFHKNSFAWTLALTLLAALLIQGAAYAEGEEPLPSTADEAETSTEPAPESIEIMSVSGGEIPAEEAAVPEEEAAQAEALPDEQSAAAEDADAPVLAAVSENEIAALAESGLILADNTGEALDMATSESAEVLAEADPYFMIGATKYSFTTTDCSPLIAGNQPCANPIQAAINLISTAGLMPTDRKIYVESGTYTGSVLVDGSMPLLDQLSGLIGLKTGANFPVINNYVNVQDTMLGFTLSGFSVTATVGTQGALRFSNNAGTLTLADLTVRNTNGLGIYILNHSGAVVMTNVISSNNFGRGAYIDNSSGNLGVTIAYSEFDQNTDGVIPSGVNDGLWIHTNGPVSLNYVSASHNDGKGLFLETPKTVTIKNSIFNLNYSAPVSFTSGYGIWTFNDYSTNHFVLENVQAENNTAGGINLVNHGNLSAKMISVRGNGIGAFFSIYGTAAVSASAFSDNGGSGLTIKTRMNITLNSVEAQLNNADGITLDNCQYDGGLGTCVGTGAVTVSGTPPNRFINNGDYGLNIISGGAVTLTNFEASDNGDSGVRISNAYSGRSGGITVNASYIPAFGTFKNILHNNSGYGLYAGSFGAISVDKVIALNNTSDGIYLGNSAALSNKTVTLKNADAWDNTSGGIYIEARGNTTITNCAAYSNGANGLEVIAIYGSATNITVNASTLKNFSDNTNYALKLDANGAVSVTNVDASGSHLGTYIDNQYAASARPLSVSSSQFSNTSGGNAGLSVYSNGLITLRGIVSNNNTVGYGIFTASENAATPQGITMANVDAINNSLTGIYIHARGSLNLSNLRANENGINGLNIAHCDHDGTACLGTGGISIGGTWNEFNDNANLGISMQPGGNVTLSNLEVSANKGDGIYLFNGYTGENGSLSLGASAGKYNQILMNGNYGINVVWKGSITVSRTIVEGSGSAGAVFHNDTSDSASSVTVSDSTFSHNWYNGLYITSKGTVTLKGVTANGNLYYTGRMFNHKTVQDGLSAESSTSEDGRQEAWYFTGDGLVDIQLRSADFIPLLYLYDSAGHMLAWDMNTGDLNDAFISAFTLPAAGDYYVEVAAKDDGWGVYQLALNNPITSITGYYLYQYGVLVDNTFGSGDVMVLPLGTKGNTFSYNGSNGLDINSNGNITVSQAEGSYNFSTGLYLVNSDLGIVKNISLAKITANSNKSSGVSASSNGAISFNGGNAEDNSGYGAFLYNADAVTPKALTVSNALFNSNHGDGGLAAWSLGSITITNAGASGNDGVNAYGVVLNNCKWDGSACRGSGIISISGRNQGQGFNENVMYGIYASSFGNISLKNTDALENGIMGAFLANNYAGAAGSILVSGTTSSLAQFSGNLAGNGLYVLSNGAIILSDIRADENGGGGVVAYNTYTPAAMPVTITRVYSHDNLNSGIYISSNGIVAGASLQTDGNGMNGLVIYNNSAASPLGITILGAETKDNIGYGISLYSRGKVTLNAICADTNTQSGLYVSTDGDVSVLSTLGENTFNANNGSGFAVGNAAKVSLSKVTINSNLDNGLYISYAADLSINTASIRGNGNNGINASVYGNATINRAQVIGNGAGTDGDGIHLEVNPAAIVSITNSFITLNEGEGIDLYQGADLILTGTFCMGNDTDDDGQENVNWYH